MPTTSVTGVPAATSDDATFRALGQAISDALGPVGGMVREYSNIDWATVARPANSATAGVEIYRLDDALQASSPAFLRVRYGSANPNARMQIWLSAGRGVDGAGNLTVDASPETNIIIGNTTVGQVGALEASSRPTGLGFMLFPDRAVGEQLVIVFGRGHDQGGNPVADRLMLGHPGGAGITQSVIRVYRAVVGWSGGTSQALPAQNLASSAHMRNVGGDIPLSLPTVVIGAERVHFPDLLCYPNADIPLGTIFNVAVLGSSIPYKAQGSRINPAWAGGGDSSNQPALAMRWE